MPRYFFNLADGHRSTDTEGTELAGLKEARLAAVTHAGLMLRDRPEEVWAGGNWRVEVADNHGRLLFTVVVLALEPAGYSS